MTYDYPFPGDICTSGPIWDLDNEPRDEWDSPVPARIEPMLIIAASSKDDPKGIVLVLTERGLRQVPIRRLDVHARGD